MRESVNTYFKLHKTKVAVWLLVTAAVAFLAPLKAFHLQWIIDSTSKTQAVMYVGLGAFVIVGSYLFESLSRRIYTSMACGAEDWIRVQVMRGVFARDMETSEREEDSAYLSLLTNDLRTLYDDYFTSIFQLVFWGGILLAALLMYLFISPLLLAVIAVISIPPFVVPKILNTKLRESRDQYSQRTAEYIQWVSEKLSGFETIWNFMREDWYRRAHKEASARSRKAEEQFHQRMNTMMTTTSFLSNLTFIIILIAGMLLVFEGTITMGYMVTACSLANFVISPCQIISQHYAKIKATKGIQMRLEEHMNAPLPDADGETEMEDIQEISAEHLSFSYPESKKAILESVDFRANPGEKIAVIGESGSGKSTFAKLLHKYYLDYSGSIRINGAELRGIPRKGYFRKAGYISQNTFLFHDTIRNNICLYETFEDWQVERAILLSGMKEFVEELPDGADTVLSENGKNLSGGQRQRIAIARLLIRDCTLILADEITASLDHDTTEQVMENLLSLDGIVIAITHDTDSPFMKRFDRIYRVQEGKFTPQSPESPDNQTRYAQ